MLVLFAAMAVYFCYYISRIGGDYVTSPVSAATYSESAVVSGLVVREELLIVADGGYVFTEARDGARVSVGAPLAYVMSTPEALRQAVRRGELITEISRLETLLAQETPQGDPAGRAESIRASVLALASASATGDLSGLDAAASTLKALLKGGADAETEARLSELKAELSAQEAGGFSAEAPVTAPRAGLFTRAADGFEAIGPDDLTDMTPSRLAELQDSGQPVPENAVGKIVTDYRWYYACTMDEADAKRFTVGDGAGLVFRRYCADTVTARVDVISPPQDGRCCVVFSTLNALEELLGARLTDAEVLFASHTGLLLPVRALHVGADGLPFVYTVTAGHAEIKKVTTIYEADGYYLVAIERNADSLRDGDTVIIGGSNITEGMLING